MTIADIFTTGCLVLAMFFFGAGTVGLIRLPDSFSKLHALTKADNVALGFVVLGFAPQVDDAASLLKLAAVWVLVQVSGASVSYLMARRLHRMNGGES